MSISFYIQKYVIDGGVEKQIQMPLYEVFQSGQVSIDGSGDWQAVSFLAAFPVGSNVKVVGIDAGGTSGRFAVSIRNVTITGFEFLPTDLDSGFAIHTEADPVTWVAVGL